MSNKISNLNNSTLVSIYKGAAILGIILFHYGAFIARPFTGTPLYGIDWLSEKIALVLHVGSQGNLVFFFLSGYGISLSKRSLNDSTVTTLLRRLEKIYPTFIGSIIFTIVLLTYFDLQSHITPVSTTLLVNLFFIRNFSYEWIDLGSSVWWFIATLVQLYIAFELFKTKLLNASPKKIIVFAILSTLLYKLAICHLNNRGYIHFSPQQLNPYLSFSLAFFDVFFIGFALGRLNYRWSTSFNNTSVLYSILAAFSLEAIGVYISKSLIGGVLNDELFAIAIFLTLPISIYLLRLLHFERILKMLAWFGNNSLGLYFIHEPIASTFLKCLQNRFSITELLLLSFPYLLLTAGIGFAIEKLSTKIYTFFKMIATNIYIKISAN